MIIRELIHLLQLLVLVSLQVLVFNHMHLFGYATPMVYICFLLYFPLNYSRCGILFWGFIIGLLTDIFSNTPGVGAASTTLAAMLQPVLLRAMAPKDSTEDMMPNFQTMGYGNYARFFIILIVIHHLLVFLLESFSYFDSLYLVLSCTSSIVLTTSIVWAMEHLLNRKS